MKVEKGKYIAIISHGDGIHYLRGPGGDSLIKMCKSGKSHADALNRQRKPRAPKVRVAIARVVEVYEWEDGNGNRTT